MESMIAKGYLKATPARYDDFLPVSAAGIFSANLGDAAKDVESKEVQTVKGFQRATGVKIVDANETYAGRQAQTMLATLKELGAKRSVGLASMKKLEGQVKYYEHILNSGTGMAA